MKPERKNQSQRKVLAFHGKRRNGHAKPRTEERHIGKSKLPPAIQQEALLLSMLGCSKREIARRLGRSYDAIDNIVEAPEHKQKQQDTLNQIYGLLPEMVRSLNYALRNEEDGNRAHLLLRDLGVLIPPAQRIELPKEKTPEEEAAEAGDLRVEWLKKFAAIAMERHDAFGTTSLPELTEWKEEEEKKHGDK